MWAQIPPTPFKLSVLWGTLSFPLAGNNDNTYLMGLFQGLNEIIHKKYTAQCLPSSKCSEISSASNYNNSKPLLVTALIWYSLNSLNPRIYIYGVDSVMTSR